MTSLSFTLRAASGLGARRQQRLRLGQAVHRIAQLIEDFSPLRNLPAFVAFEESLHETLKAQRWQ